MDIILKGPTVFESNFTIGMFSKMGRFSHSSCQSVNEYEFSCADLKSSPNSSIEFTLVLGLSGSEFCVHLLTNGVQMVEGVTVQ